MKKLYLMALAVALATAGATAAALPSRLIKPAIKTVRSFDVKHSAGTVVAATAPEKAPAKAEARWESIGTGKMTDDILGGLVQVQVSTYDVEVMEDKANPGMYRIMDPWKNNPYLDKSLPDITFGQGNSYYITIDATNPDYVRVLRSPVGLADRDGEAALIGVTELVGKLENLTQEKADTYAGKLKDGIISFSVEESLALLQGASYYTTNYFGKFALALPGAELPVDYEFDIDRKEYFCPDNDGNYHLSFTGDARIAGIRYKLVPTVPQDDNEVAALIADVVAGGTPVAINTAVTVSVKDVVLNSVVLVAVALDDKGVAQSAYAMNLSVPLDDSAQWDRLGKATFTEGFISCVLGQFFDVETYEVDVERNKTNHGLIRVVDPYKGWSAADQFALDHNHSHYIYFNIENVDNVYVLSSPLGIRMDPYGEFGIYSDYAEFLDNYGKEICDMLGLKTGGTYRNGVIEYDADCDIKLLPVAWGEYVYTNYKDNPEYDEDAAEAAKNAGEVYDVPEYLPGDFRLDMSKAGIGSIAVDFSTDDTATYYNLQGQRVSRPAAGTVCIKVQNGKGTKVQIR